ncbi:cytochrome P450 4c3 [Caerostris darwini]|uniref:Cytochrome P450 4c3 n=1 Tax=Caerostris darwini TaxID=1538125 RepID=A0AAV4RL25_9ARAC|nr:cytochrome P450 4c3 [Caerostris darwini]
MLFEVVVCAFIGIVSVLAILTLWRKKYSRFSPDNNHGVFQVLLDAMDSILFITSGKKNALDVYIMKYLKEMSKKFRQYPLFTLWFCGVRWVIIHKAEAVKDLLKEKRIVEKSEFYDFFKPYVGTGIFTCDSTQWKARRKLLAPCFQSSMLKGYLTVFNEHAQKLVEFLHEETGKEFTCIESPLALCTLDILCETIFGVKLGAPQSEVEEFVTSLHRLLEVGTTRIWKFWQWPDFLFHCSKTYRENFQHLRIAHAFSRSIVKERKLKYINGEMGDGSRRPKCLLDVLLKLHIEDKVLDEDGVRQEVDTFIVGGHDTIAIAVKWALFLIGLYPEVQERIHQELDSVLGADSKGPLSVGELNELKYLDCVLKEGNRLYPPGPIIGRKVSEEVSICGYKIPKRTTVLVAPFLVHRDEDVFPDPEKFDPERFLPENSAHIPDCGYIPFAAGPRNCMGRAFGEMEVKILVCHILRSFSLHSLDSRDQVLPIAKLSLQSSQPARIQFRRRQQ